MYYRRFQGVTQIKYAREKAVTKIVRRDLALFWKRNETFILA